MSVAQTASRLVAKNAFRARCARRQTEAMRLRLGGDCFPIFDNGVGDCQRYWWGTTIEHARARMRRRRGLR